MGARWLASQDSPADTEGQTAVSYGDDARMSDWARPYVMALREMGFASRNDVELFRARDAASRADACEMLHWLLERSEAA